MAQEITTFGIDNDNIRGGLKKFKAKKGEIVRAGIVYTDPKAMFAGSKIHYSQRYFHCKSGYCCEKLGEPKWRVGSVMIKYATDNLGNPKSPIARELIPWIVSDQSYNKLSRAE